MSLPTETTAENLRSLRESNEMNQLDVATLLGITQTAVSKIETGTRALSPTEKAILDWYFFGTLPPRLENPSELKGILEFSEEEWAIIGEMARRVGQTHKEWIASVCLNIIGGKKPNLTAVEDAPACQQIKGS